MAATTPDPDRLRIGHAERDAAIADLDAHLAAGRIDAEEYGDRVGRASVARTWADLAVLFDDLPAPRPGPPSRTPAALRPAGIEPVRPRVESWGAALLLTPLLLILGVALLRVPDGWAAYLMLLLATGIAAAIRARSRS